MDLIQAEGVKGLSVCAIYTRQSSNSRSDLTSCQIQFEACEAFIRAHKHNGWRWIEEHFNDEGWSGASLDRPALQRLLVKIRSGEIDRLLVYRLDRLSRSVIDSVELLNELRELGIDLVIVTAPEIGSTATDSLLLNLLSIFAEFERELIAKRIADARAALKRQGRRVGGALPLGYDADPLTKQLVVNPKEIKQVRAMFEMAAEGMPPSEIARIANGKKWRTKTRKAKRSGKKSGGNPWTARQVVATLSNPVYMGKITDDGLLRDGIHIPAVSEDMFAQVRAQLVSRRTRSPGRRDRIDLWFVEKAHKMPPVPPDHEHFHNSPWEQDLPLLSLPLHECRAEPLPQNSGFGRTNRRGSVSNPCRSAQTCSGNPPDGSYAAYISTFLHGMVAALI
jgi:site-specific DNA recombinase